MTQSYQNICALVKKKFYLTKESNKLFEKLLFNQPHADEYKKIAEQPDKRLFVDLDSEILKKHDTSFARFYRDFSIFCKSVQLTYEDYSKGAIQGTKITKAIRKFYLKRDVCNIKELLQLIRIGKCQDNRQAEQYKRDFIQKLFEQSFSKKESTGYEKIIDYYGRDDWNLFDGEKIYFKMRNLQTGKPVGLRKKISNKAWSKIITATGIFEDLTNILNEKYLSKRSSLNYKICLSLNFSDWILAATGNSWTSCISLFSNTGYWSGLAGLVGDANRIMIYITDMKAKEYAGIKSYNMIERMWAFTFVADSDRSKTFICQNDMYPKKEGYNILPLKEYFSGDFEIYNEKARPYKRLVSKYTMPALWHTISKSNNQRREKEKLKPDYPAFTSCIFEDTMQKRFTDEWKEMIYVIDSPLIYGINCYGWNKKEKDYEPVGNSYMYNSSIDGIPAA